jgi:hypothetical protein
MGLRELQLDCGATRAAEGEGALKAASDVVAASVADRVNRTRRDSNGAKSFASPGRACRWCFTIRGIWYRRPRHRLKGRQDADAVDRAELRIKPLEARALCGVTRLFTDDGEMLTHPYLYRARANPGADLHVLMPRKAAKTAARGTLG